MPRKRSKKKGTHKKAAPSLTMRMTTQEVRLFDSIGQLGLERAEFLHRLFAREDAVFNAAPYYSKDSLYFTLVQGDGTTLGFLRQKLWANHPEKFMPVSMTFKEEKRHELSADGGFGSEFQDRWLLNAFSCWSSSNEFVGPPTSFAADPVGVSKKHAYLEIDVGKQSGFGVEKMHLIRDHALSRGKHHVPGQSKEDDRAAQSITIPTYNAEFLLIVDLDLYKNPKKRREAQADWELRYLTGGLWKGKGAVPPRNSLDTTFGRVDSDHDEDAIVSQRGRSLCRLVRSRIRELRASPDVWQEASSGDLTDEDIEKICLPKEYLFARIHWPMPPFGLQVCLTWNMAD